MMAQKLRDAHSPTKQLEEDMEDLAEAELRAEKAAKRLARAQAEINKEFSDLQLLIKTDLSKSYDEMLDDIDKVKESEKDLKERIAEVNSEIGEFRREIQEIKDEEGPVTEAQQDRIDGFKERISDAGGSIADLREELGKVPARVDEITEAWQRQTKELIFNLAVQRFQVDGLSKEELKVLATLAGPKGLGLIDEAGQAMIEIIAEAGDILDLTGDQSEIVSGLIVQVAEDITSVTGEAADLTTALEEMTRDVWILRIEQDLFPRRAGRDRRPAFQEPADPTEEDWWDLIRQSIVVSATPIVSTSSVSEGDNLNLTINTSAPVEPIIADFRMMRAMQSRAS
jgi:DNA repair exonuclease SbcCD ATPase subunit